MPKLTRAGRVGAARMVDIRAKPVTHRTAVAAAEVRMAPSTLRTLRAGRAPKGNVFEVARVAGIAAAKQTASLIPLCHPVALTHISVDCAPRLPDAIEIRARAEALDRTGVEMEALTAAAVCALAVYDMCKGLDRSAEIRSVRLLEKSGGRSGRYVRGRGERSALPSSARRRR